MGSRGMEGAKASVSVSVSARLLEEGKADMERRSYRVVGDFGPQDRLRRLSLYFRRWAPLGRSCPHLSRG